MNNNSIASKFGRFIGGAIGTILLSGATQIGISVAVGLTEKMQLNFSIFILG